jgi:hypothetical protein
MQQELRTKPQMAILGCILVYLIDENPCVIAIQGKKRSGSISPSVRPSFGSALALRGVEPAGSFAV